ncbi:MAG TPA: ATP-binding cassette domain-containing protein [Firmicutes bacterium]|nr:ATP-binding cassette domain-containing protein [Bacillota bacterium]
MGNGQPIIVVEDLTKVYPGGITAVNGISFHVRQGEIFGFLGPNGAGKSTTIMMLTTLIKPTSGRATVHGYDIVREANAVRLSLGYVSQDLAVDDALTARENLYLQGRFYHLPKPEIEKRIDEVLKLVNLHDRADNRVETYSGGMRKRLDIAEGLIHRPRILFLDEPTLGLDIQTRREIWRYIENLRAEYGMTIFLTTHYMDEADSLCDRIAIIDRGVIKAIDSPSTLKSQIGGDIVTLKIDSVTPERVQAAVRATEALPFVRSVKKQENSNDSYVVVVNDGETAIPAIFHAIGREGASISSIALKKPTLDDVYLFFTGKELRQESGSREDAMRARMIMRRVRR